MLMSVAITAITLAATAVACTMILRWKRSARFLANFLKNRGQWGLLYKMGLEDYLRPCATEEWATPSGFNLVTIKDLYRSGVTAVHNLELRDDDVFLLTFPKSGTLWTQEIVWLLCNNVDTEAATATVSSVRSPYVEMKNWCSHVELMPRERQRVIRSHLPYEALPKQLREGRKCKIIYVARNPKDACVSYFFFHQMNLLLPKPGSWSEFLSKFASGNLLYGSWFSHVLMFWKKYQEGDKRIHFMTYENLKKDTRKEVLALAKFLEKELSENQIDRIIRHCSFGEMKKTLRSSNIPGSAEKKKLFMRKGQVGDWKNHFTMNQNDAFDEIYGSEMKDSGLQMVFEL